MIPIQTLTSEISPEHPCGQFDEMTDAVPFTISSSVGLMQKSVFGGMIAGEEAVPQKSDVEKWMDIRKDALKYLQGCRHLEVGYNYVLAEVNLEGFAGLEEGLRLFRRWISNFWEHLHPQPDLEGGETIEAVRLRQVELLASQQVLDGLAEAKMTKCRVGEFTLREVESALAYTPQPAPPDESADRKAERLEKIRLRDRVKAALPDTCELNPEFYPERVGDIVKCIDGIEKLEAAFADQIQSEGAPPASPPANLSALKVRLETIKAIISPYCPELELAATPEPGESGEQEMQESAIPGTITSRENALDMLERIIEYFAQHEPTSPVPFLLARAQRVVTMNFQEIVEEFKLAANPPIDAVFGANIAQQQAIFANSSAQATPAEPTPNPAPVEEGNADDPFAWQRGAGSRTD